MSAHRRSLRRAIVLLGLLVPCVAGAKDVAEPDPFLVRPDSLRGWVDTIALEPVDVPSQFGGADEEGARLGGTVAARLSEAGFVVVPPESVSAAWTEAQSAGGGLFDPRTGRRDPTRVVKVRSILAQLLRERYQADVRFRVSIVIVAAEFESGRAKWDGVSRDIGGAGFLDLLFGGSEGRTPAFSLAVDVEDLAGRPLYAHRTGLQPLQRVVKGKLESYPPEERFGDVSGREYALDRTLSPWVLSVLPASSRP